MSLSLSLSLSSVPISFIQYDDLVTPFWQCDFLVGKCLNSVPHDINAPVIRGIQFEHCILE